MLGFPSWQRGRVYALMPRPGKYDDELKERAVRLAIESGRPIAHVAADLGIGAESLRGWGRQANASSGSRHG